MPFLLFTLQHKADLTHEQEILFCNSGQGRGTEGIQIIISKMGPVEWLIRRLFFLPPAVYRVVNMPNELVFEEQITKNLKGNRLNQPQSFIIGIDLGGPSLQPRVLSIFNFQAFFSVILSHSVLALC